MAEEDIEILIDATSAVRSFKGMIVIDDKPTDADWERLIKAAEDILKLAGAR